MAPYLLAGRRNHVTANTQMKKFALHKHLSAEQQSRYGVITELTVHQFLFHKMSLH